MLTSAAKPVITGLLQAKIIGRSGKLKRLRLETLEGEVEVRLPKLLRAAAREELQLGQPLRLWVERKGKDTRVVAFVPLNPKAILAPACQGTCVSVCSSKTCCRRGGDELYRKLVEASQSVPGLSVRKCRCLKHCKRGPNVRVDRGSVQGITPREVPYLVEKIAANLVPPPAPAPSPILRETRGKGAWN